MDELLSEDQGAYILRIGLYVLRNFDDQNTTYGDKADYGQHHRIKKLYGKPDIDEIIRSETTNKRGQLLITSEYEDLSPQTNLTKTASVDGKMQDQVQNSAHRCLDRNIELMHLAFQPREPRPLWSSRLPEIQFQGVV